MDSTVAGALIGGGFAVVGFGISAWQNAVSLRANRRLARDQLLFDKRSAVYERMIGAVTRDATGFPDFAARLRDLAACMDQVMAYAAEDVVEQYSETLSAIQNAVVDPGQRVQHAVPRALSQSVKLTECIRKDLQQAPKWRWGTYTAFFQTEEPRKPPPAPQPGTGPVS